MSKEIYADEIQIRDLNGSKSLILICPDEDTSVSLMEMILETDGDYTVKYAISQSNTSLITLFLNSPEYIASMEVTSNKNFDNYPPLNWLSNDEVTCLSTGWLDQDNSLTHCDLLDLVGRVQKLEL